MVPASLNEIVTICLKRDSKIRYGPQDASRFGLKTITRRRLTLNKVNPLGKGQGLFTACYLYGVVEPLTGEGMSQAYDRMHTENFPQCLNDFSQGYPTAFPVIQTDKARVHCSNDRVMPDNVRLLYQPPYSPPVNSTDQVWEGAKGESANQLFPPLAILKETLSPLFISKPKAFFAALTGRKFLFDSLQKMGRVPDTA